HRTAGRPARLYAPARGRIERAGAGFPAAPARRGARRAPLPRAGQGCLRPAPQDAVECAQAAAGCARGAGAGRDRSPAPGRDPVGGRIRSCGARDAMTDCRAWRLQLLFEREGLPSFDFPEPLRIDYGGGFGLAADCLYANFVASVDGVVALRTQEESGHIISGGSEADRFVMVLLRACADAVLLGAGTFRKAGGHLWHAGHIHPVCASQFADLRRRLGLSPQPPLIVVTATGQIDPAQPALRDAIVVTTPAGEARLRGRLPPTTRVEAGPVRLGALLENLRAEGYRRILTEGGPTLASQP